MQCIALAVSLAVAPSSTAVQVEIGVRVTPLLQVDRLLFKDLNKNGRLDGYEDWRLSVEARVSDLVSQMTLEEKAGSWSGRRSKWAPAVRSTNRLSTGRIRSRVEIAEGTRLGIPALFVSNPRHSGAAPVRRQRGRRLALEVAGRFEVYPGNRFDERLRPFQAAIEEGVAAVMPYYSIPEGRTREAVGMAFNREIVTELLEAGTDLIGSDGDPEILIRLVRTGALPEARLDESVRRILSVRMSLGIFENPYANPDLAARVVRSPEHQAKADLAQLRSIVLLRNASGVLPLRRGQRLYVEGVDPAVAARYGFVSTSGPDGADMCLVRLAVGAEPPRPGAPQGARFGIELRRAGAGALLRHAADRPIDLTVPAEPLARLRVLMRAKPTVVAIHLDRPYVIPEIAREAAALLAIFGVGDPALLDVVTGAFAPSGRLPFELPSSMEAVRAQLEDVPGDSKNPLFLFGAGLGYPTAPRKKRADEGR